MRVLIAAKRACVAFVETCLRIEVEILIFDLNLKIVVAVTTQFANRITVELVAVNPELIMEIMKELKFQ